MDVLEAIRTRRTIHAFRPDPVPAVLERIVEAAVWAPNHKLTEPWHFYIVTGETKRKLAEIRRRVKVARHPQPDSDHARRIGEVAYQEMADVPAVIVATSTAAGNPVQVEEDYAATACAIQNLMLAAWAEGVGTFWGTGPLAHAPEIHELLGIPPGRRVVAILFVGYPHEIPRSGRTPVAQKSDWFE